MQKKTPTPPVGDIDQYLDRVPEPARTTLEKLRQTIRASLPKNAIETISYGIPTFKVDKSVVGFAAFKKHCSLFPMSGGVLETFGEELAPYRTSKGTLQFPPDQGLPAALVKKIIKARLKEIAAESK